MTPGAMNAALAARVNARLAARGQFVMLRIHGTGLGDAFCMTAAMRRLHELHGWRFIVVTRFPDLFRHHPLVARLVDYPRLGFAGRRVVKWLARHCTAQGSAARVGVFEYRPGERVPRETWLAEHREPRHLAALYTAHWGVAVGDGGEWRTQAAFSPAEREAFAQRFPAAGRYALVKPNAGSPWTPNKDWDVARFQAVVDALPHMKWLQPGAAADPLLAGVSDLRGRTTLRELLFLVSRARFVLAPEGFYNHAAAAFAVPSFVVASGYSTTAFAAYPATRFIVRTPQVPCAPCWLREPCPVPGKPCTSDIGVDAVIAAIEEHLASAPEPNPLADVVG